MSQGIRTCVVLVIGERRAWTNFPLAIVTEGNSRLLVKSGLDNVHIRFYASLSLMSIQMEAFRDLGQDLKLLKLQSMQMDSDIE